MINSLVPFFIHFIPIVIGWFVIRFWQKKIQLYFLEKISLSYGLGAILITLLLFLLSLLGFHFSQLNIILFTVVLMLLLSVASCIYLPFKLTGVGPHCPFAGRNQGYWRKAFIGLLVLIIIFNIIFVFIEAYLRPVVQFDAIANWFWRTKVFFTQEQIHFNTQSDYYLGGGGHENYPLHISLFGLWAAKILGHWDERAISLISAFYYFNLIVIFYCILKRFGRPSRAIIFTFLLATLPLLIYHGFAAYADLPLAFYLTTAVLLFFLGLNEQKLPYLLLGSIFAFGASWTKNEGLFLALIIFIAAFLITFIGGHLRKNYKKFLASLFLFLVLISLWLILLLTQHLGLSNFGAKQDSVLNQNKLGFYPAAIQFILADLSQSDSWHSLWLIFVLSALFFSQKFFQKKNLFILLNVFGFLAFYLCLYVFTFGNFEYIKVGVILNRNLLTVAPLVVFYLGLLFGGRSKEI